MSQPSCIVVKVGGSLFNLPGLDARLRTFLAGLECPRVFLFPGGGATADVIRDMDQIHSLGQESAHWLALRALTMNAYLLHALLPEVPLASLHPASPASEQDWGSEVPVVVTPDKAILDPFALAMADEHNRGHLPHTWDVTSDSLAVRAAHLLGAAELNLLKSITTLADMAWSAAARAGYVDRYFPKLMEQCPELKVRLVNLRDPIA
jgi:aspartokinase-like uncharacterized kinase